MPDEISADVARVKKALAELGEHFDAVQIFASRHESGVERGTVRVIDGVGNWFARYGQVREWVVREEETSRVHARKNCEEQE